MALLIWTLTRLSRAAIQYWDNDLFYGYIIAAKAADPKKKTQVNNKNLYLPMFTISIFCLVEIWPIWHVLDSGFIQTFLDQKYVKRINDLTEPLLGDREDE